MCICIHASAQRVRRRNGCRLGGGQGRGSKNLGQIPSPSPALKFELPRSRDVGDKKWGGRDGGQKKQGVEGERGKGGESGKKPIISRNVGQLLGDREKRGITFAS